MLPTAISRRPRYTGGMLRTGITLIVALTLAGCGTKGDLYLPPEESAESTSLPAPVETDQDDKGERRTIPPTPDPSLSR